MSKLKFYYGVMGSGKTTELIKAYNIYKRKGMNPIVIKPSFDDREGKQIGWGKTSSRITKESIPAYYFNNIEKDINILDYGILLVDEVQFLNRKDILSLCRIIDNAGIDIIAYGLKTDTNGNLFEGAASLLALADETRELETLCEIPGCYNKATLHLRYINGELDKSNKAIAIEKDNIAYKSVCRACWSKAKN